MPQQSDTYTEEEERDMASLMVQFCDKLMDEFVEFCEFETGNDFDEDLFDAMSENINPETANSTVRSE